MKKYLMILLAATAIDIKPMNDQQWCINNCNTQAKSCLDQADNAAASCINNCPIVQEKKQCPYDCQVLNYGVCIGAPMNGCGLNDGGSKDHDCVVQCNNTKRFAYNYCTSNCLLNECQIGNPL